MKIFATSDVHGNRRIMDKLSIVAADVDLILVCGDVGGKDGRGKTFRQFSEYQRQDVSRRKAVSFWATMTGLNMKTAVIFRR